MNGNDLNNNLNNNVNNSLNNNGNNFFNDNYYSNSVNENVHINQANNNNNKTSDKKFFIMILIIVLLLFAAIIFFLIMGKDNKNNGNVIVELNAKQLNLEVGKKEKIKYDVENGDKSLEIKWSSSDPTVISIDDDGNITALKEGIATITATYVSNNSIKEEICVITVVTKIEEDDEVVDNNDSSNNDNDPNNNSKPDNSKPNNSKPDNSKPNNNSGTASNTDKQETVKDTTDPSLKVNFAVGSKDIWNTSDVQLSVVASDNSNKVSVKYALNCSSNCQYTNVIDNKIKISTEGNNTVTVVATDSSNNSTEVKVPVKIDKTVPTITYSETINDVIYDNTGTKEICAICSDKLSGCKSEKSCIKTSASNDNVVLSVVDNAGNKVSSKAFKIVYDTTKPKCSLKVSSSGKVTATHSDAGGSDLAYYGFSSSYSGTNTSSKTYDSEGSKTYYVKDRAGNKNTCKISIKSRSVNCVCPSGYSVISSVSSTKCSKKQGAAGWGSWSVLGSPTKVDSCASLNTCNTSKTADCYKCIEDQADGRYVKTIYMRKRNVCPSGTTLYSAACYYVKSKTCEKEFYS